MARLVISGKELVRLLERQDFAVVRIAGSHHRMRHPDGRVTTVPVHKNDDLPQGLLRKIVREDLGVSFAEFEALLRGKNGIKRSNKVASFDSGVLGHDFLQKLQKRPRKLFPFQRKLDCRFQEIELVANVVALAFDQVRVEIFTF